MQSQTINEQARRKYENFDVAINTVRTTLDELIAMTKKMRNSPNMKFEGWQVPDKSEVTGALQKASGHLDALRKEATAYKAELLSRTWRI